MMSPFPFAGPDRATILFGDFHSADNKQSVPQIVSPRSSEWFYVNFLIEQNPPITPLPIKSFG